MNEQKPLSYEDLRRFLLLVVSLCLAALLIASLGRVLMLFVVVFFLAMVLNPIIAWMEKRRVKRGLGVALLMAAIIGSMVGAGFLVVPTVVEQVNSLATKAPQYQTRIEDEVQNAFERYPALQKAVMGDDAGKKGKKSKVKLAIFAPQLQKFASNIGPNLGSQLLATALAALGGVFTFIIALLLVAFILISPRPLVAGFLSAVPERHREAAGRSVARISSQMLAWVRATLINGLITGVSTGILLYFLGVQPAFIFGILSCLGEFVPNLGPIAASIPALFVAAGMGTNKLLLTGVAYFFVQQLESNVLVPFIMGGQMELHPVTIVFFALAMGSLFGITGAILAVPTAAVIKVLFDEFYLKPNRVPVEEINKRTQSVILDREWPEKSTLS